MALSPQDIQRLGELLGAPGTVTERIQGIRAAYPKLAVTHCTASEVDMEHPVLESERGALYLVDGTGHCWHFTKEPTAASGVVVVFHS